MTAQNKSSITCIISVENIVYHERFLHLYYVYTVCRITWGTKRI